MLGAAALINAIVGKLPSEPRGKADVRRERPIVCLRRRKDSAQSARADGFMATG